MSHRVSTSSVPLTTNATAAPPAATNTDGGTAPTITRATPAPTNTTGTPAAAIINGFRGPASTATKAAATATHGTPAAAIINGGRAPSLPAHRRQLHNSPIPTYPPTPPYHNRRRSIFCLKWCLLTALLIVLLGALTGGILYAVYQPHFPSFSVSSLQVSQFNLTSSYSELLSEFNLTLLTRNPNSKLTLVYDQITVFITAKGVNLGASSIPGFTHATKNTTSLKTIVASTSPSTDFTSRPLKIQLESKVVKIGAMKCERVGIKVNCSGMKIALPVGKSKAVVTTVDSKCKVTFQIRIWEWNL